MKSIINNFAGLRLILVLCLFSITSLYSLDIYSYNLELFSIGAEVNIEENNSYNIHLGLPAVYFFEKKANLILEVNSVNFEFSNDQSFNYHILNSRIYYSFLKSTQYIFGPYIGTSFETFWDLAYVSDVGISFRYLHDVKKYSIVPNFVLRGGAIDLGYSIDKNEFFLKLTMDPFLFAYLSSYVIAENH